MAVHPSLLLFVKLHAHSKKSGTCFGAGCPINCFAASTSIYFGQMKHHEQLENTHLACQCVRQEQEKYQHQQHNKVYKTNTKTAWSLIGVTINDHGARSALPQRMTPKIGTTVRRPVKIISPRLKEYLRSSPSPSPILCYKLWLMTNAYTCLDNLV